MADLVPRGFFDEPWLPMRRLRNWLEESPLDWPPLHGADASLALDIARDDRAGTLIATASLPGFAKDEVDVQVDDDILTIRAEHKEEQETKDDQFYRRERHYGALQRRVVLPDHVKGDDATATLKDGVLTVTVPVAAAEPGKRIEVSTE